MNEMPQFALNKLIWPPALDDFVQKKGIEDTQTEPSNYAGDRSCSQPKC